MRIAGIVNDSVVDGSGVRDVVFVQGCKHNCPGCHNPDTHDMNGGREMSIEEILDQCHSDNLTVSGGDPFYQELDLVSLVSDFKEQRLHANVWVYTGFLWEEIKDSLAMPYIDVLVDGMYDKTKPTARRFVGSDNQRIIDPRRSWETGKLVLWNSPEIYVESEPLNGVTITTWVANALKGDKHYAGRTASKEEAASQN